MTAAKQAKDTFAQRAASANTKLQKLQNRERGLQKQLTTAQRKAQTLSTKLEAAHASLTAANQELQQLRSARGLDSAKEKVRKLPARVCVCV